MQGLNKATQTEQKPLNASNSLEEVTLAKNISFKNKDNFWNLMFILGMLVGSMTIGMMFAIVIMAFVLKYFNGVSVKENKIFNSQGREIDIKQVPKLGWVIACTIGVLLFITAIFNTELKQTNELIGSIIFSLLMYGVPALMFILKNCPISILFNFKIWSMPHPDRGNGHHIKHDHSTPSSAYFTDARFSHLPNNVYNRDRFK